MLHSLYSQICNRSEEFGERSRSGFATAKSNRDEDSIRSHSEQLSNVVPSHCSREHQKHTALVLRPGRTKEPTDGCRRKTVNKLHPLHMDTIAPKCRAAQPPTQAE